jgi:hypothetical protein
MTKLTIRRGAIFRCIFENKNADEVPVPLTGLQVRLQIGYRDGTPALLSYDSATTPAVPQLTLDATAGTVEVVLGATLTKTLPIGGGLEFDLDVYDPANLDDCEPLASGTIFVSGEVGP